LGWSERAEWLDGRLPSRNLQLAHRRTSARPLSCEAEARRAFQ
jgi:hypothetical protein